MKKKPNVKNKRGQSTLETAVVLFMLVLFLGSVTNIWLWMNNQIVKRQIEYNATRVEAGTSLNAYKMVWPVYTPDSLAECEVIK